MSEEFASLKIVGKSPHGRRTCVYLNGADISRGLRGITYRADVSGRHDVILHLHVDQAEIEDDVRYEVFAGSADVLEHLGWTPPADQNAQVNG